MASIEVDEHSFLGEDFLVWLWWNAETRGGVYAVGDNQQIGVTLDRMLEFVDEATGVRVVVRGDAPTRAPEAREALSRGMRLVRAGLLVSVDAQNVSLVLDGPSFDFRSVKMDRPEGETPGERDAEGLSTLFGMVDAIDRLYRNYMLERMESNFVREDVPAIGAWARQASADRRASASASASEGAKPREAALPPDQTESAAEA